MDRLKARLAECGANSHLFDPIGEDSGFPHVSRFCDVAIFATSQNREIRGAKTSQCVRFRPAWQVGSTDCGCRAALDPMALPGALPLLIGADCDGGHTRSTS